MHRFREITGRDLRLLHHSAVEWSDLHEPDALMRHFIRVAHELLPGTFIGWNNWSRDMRTALTSHSSPAYDHAIRRLMAPLNAVVHHHPLIAGGAWQSAYQRPQRLSDFQTRAAFRHNPLHHEVYRHLDSRFQLAFNIPTNDEKLVCLTWNRLHRDFTERDRDMLHLIGRRLGVVLGHLIERQRLEQACHRLAPQLPRTGSNRPDILSLNPVEGRLLAGLIQGKTREEIALRLGCRRDTLDRRIAALRERLGFENTHHLLRAFNEARPVVRSRANLEPHG